eukprot:9114919-Prorocentrum_lima.AAC.1
MAPSLVQNGSSCPAGQSSPAQRKPGKPRQALASVEAEVAVGRANSFAAEPVVEQAKTFMRALIQSAETKNQIA